MQPRRAVGFGQQTDFHLPGLTVKETLQYACEFTRGFSLKQLQADPRAAELLQEVHAPCLSTM